MLHPISWLSKTKWNLRQEIIWDREIAANIRGWRFWQVEERLKNYKHEQDKVNKELSLHLVKETFKDKKARGLYSHKTNRNKVVNNYEI